MKLIIEKADLVSALAKIVAVSPSRGTIPVLANVALSATKDLLTLRTTNLDMEAKVSVKCTVEQPGETTVNAARLFEIARNVPAGAQIKMDLGDDPRMKVSAGRSRFLLPVIPAADFPVLEKQKYPTQITVSAPVLADALSRVSWAQSTSASTFYLNGVHIIADAGAVKLETSNSHVCALAEFEAEMKGGARVIAPTAAVAVIQRLLDGAQGPVEIGISEGRITVAVEGVTLSSKLVDGAFPDISRLVPTDIKQSIVIDADALSEAVKRVCGASDDKIPAVSLTFSPGSLALSSRGSDSEEAHDEVECEYVGDEFRITVTTDYVTRCISALNADALNIEVAPDGIKMVWSSDAKSRALIMGRRG